MQQPAPDAASQYLDDVADVAELIEKTLTDPPPVNFSSGGTICPGVNAELDHYVGLSRDAKSWMAEYA